MDWKSLDTHQCSVSRTADVVGDSWTAVVLRDLFNGITRFDDLATHLGIARNVLTRRLTALVDAGVVVRVPYQEPGRRERHEYQLTAAGRDLRLEHPGCGAPVHVELRCAEGHALEPGARLHAVPGPGARKAG